jgi:translation initiation factor 3 subunit C
MEAIKARALNGVKQKVRKAAREFETQLKTFEADPEAFEAAYQATIVPDVVQTTREPPRVVANGSDDEGAPGGAPAGDEFTTVGKGGKQYEFTKDTIYKTLKAVQEARGKKVRRHFCLPWIELTHRIEHRSCRTDEDSRETLGSRCYAI